MTVEQLLFSALKDLVGNRVYPDIIPQSDAPVLPCIRYAVIGGDNAVTNYGNAAEDDESVRVQIDVYTQTAAERANLRQKLRAKMDALYPTAVIMGTPRTAYEEEFKVFRLMAEYMICQ